MDNTVLMYLFIFPFSVSLPFFDLERQLVGTAIPFEIVLTEGWEKNQEDG